MTCYISASKIARNTLFKKEIGDHLFINGESGGGILESGSTSG
jgi:hypothetical protein